MDPNNIPVSVVDQLRGPFRGKFDYIVLMCPTFVYNKTYDGFVNKDPYIFVVNCQQEEVENWLKLVSFFFEKTNTLIILDERRPHLLIHPLRNKTRAITLAISSLALVV